ncbi:MAG: 50S ribosomal protein L35 [Bdellovibrionales bacterium]|nr:50S ribosomal protein L35 [Bdellovibrionales bacterium]
MKFRTHAGAKKRLVALKSGKVKRKHCRKRHRLENKTASRKANLTGTTYVDAANMKQVERLLGI